MSEKVASRPVQGNVLSSATRVLDALKVICLSDSPVSLSSLAAHLGTSEVTAYRAVQTLVASGFVRNSGGSRSGYEASWQIVELSAPMLARNELRTLAQPVLRALADTYGESITLAAPVGSSVLFVDRVSGNRNIEFYCNLGRTLPLHIGAASRAVLAHYPDTLFEQYIAGPLTRMTDATKTDADALRLDRQMIKERGYAISREDVEVGITGVAAPIFNSAGDVLGAAAIADISVRWAEADIEERGQSIVKACAQISERCALLRHEPSLDKE